MKQLRVAIGGGVLAAGLLPGMVSAQADAQSWTVEVLAGGQIFAESSAIKTGVLGGVEALYQYSPRLALGPSVEFVRVDTDGSFFVAAMDFGADEARVFQVGQTLTALQYGGNARLSLLAEGDFRPYLTAGVGGYTLYLGAQTNDAPVRKTALTFQGGGGFTYALTAASGINLDVRDVVYTDFDRETLNPIRPDNRNRRPDGSIRFPAAERASTPDPQDTIHNIRFSLGFYYIPGANR